MTKDLELDPIPEAVSRLRALFDSELADVRFGDLDATALERATASVRAAARELAEAEALAAAARASLESTRAALLQLGQRALAYARIYADGSPELAERLETIAIGGETRRAEPRPITPGAVEASPRRRGRPPKQLATSTGTLALGTLPNGTPPSPEEDAATA
jgi:hypothetical protein